MERDTAIIGTLVLYKVVLVGFGLWAQRRTVDGADFFLGGRGLGPWVAAISASASSSSAWTLLGASGAAYAWGLSAVWLWVACVGGFALNWYVLAPRLRQTSLSEGALTVTDLLAGPSRQGVAKVIRWVASAIILISLATYVASQFQGAGKTFQTTFGMGLSQSVLIGGGIVLFYTLLGGFWAVSLTDTLQGLMMAVTSLILPLAALLAVGGVGPLMVGLEREGVELLSLSKSNVGLGAVGFVVGLLGIGLGYPGQPHVVNRFMALRDASALRWGRRIAMGWAVVVYSGMLILGWCGRALGTAIDDNETVFIALTNELFSPVVAGVMLAAVLSAIMSTADSQLLVAASALTHDVGDAGAKLVLHSRVVIVVLSVAAMILAIFGNQEIFSKVLFAWGAMGAAFGPPLLVRCLSGPMHPRFVLAAIVTGFVTSVAAYWILAVKGGVTERVVPFALALLIAWLGRRVRR